MNRLQNSKEIYLRNYAAYRVTFWNKQNKKKTVVRYGLGRCVYQISGLYHFSFGEEVAYTQRETPTHKPTCIEQKCENTLRLCHADFDSPTVKGFKNLVFFPTKIGYGPSLIHLTIFLLYKEGSKISGRDL